MKRGICVGVALLLSVSVAYAAGLKGVMKSWRSPTNSAKAMANGSEPYDAAAVRKLLQAYIADSDDLKSHLSTSAESEDLKRRFTTFQNDAKAALGQLGSAAQFKAAYAPVMANCSSCHDKYRN